MSVHAPSSSSSRRHSLQAGFAAALLDSDRDVPSGLAAADGDIRRRFAVYRNNVVTGLIDALRTRFPAVERIVGAEFFLAMAQVYLRRHPPYAPMMFQFGDALPAFLETFAPASDLEYLPDIARIEAARTRAYHAADALPLDAGVLATLDPASLFALAVAAHPSLTLIRSIHPAATIWAMNAGIVALAPVDDWRGEDAAVARPADDVVVQPLSPDAAMFLEALISRPTIHPSTLGATAACVIKQRSSFDLVASLAELLGARLLVEAPAVPRNALEAS